MSLRVLIVDDTPDKCREIRAAIESSSVPCDIDTVTDSTSAKQKCATLRYDIIVLDVVLPLRFGEEPSPQNGLQLLSELSSSPRLRKPRAIVGITQFEESFIVSSKPFHDELWHLIRYDKSDNAWKAALDNRLKYLSNEEAERQKDYAEKFDYDCAIICALHSPELELFKFVTKKYPIRSMNKPGDSTEYLEVTIPDTDGRSLRIVAAAAPRMGIAAASVLTMKLINWFRPRVVAMCGIAAGVKSRCELGDLVIADLAWDYNSGKLAEDGHGETYLHPDPKHVNVEPDLLERLTRVASERKFLDEIQRDWPGQKPLTKISAHVAPISSGSAVVQSTEMVEKIVTQNRKLVGIDMEGYGVMYAAEFCPKPRPSALVIKGVCDFADAKKNDLYQRYASFVSASYLVELLRHRVLFP